MTKESNVPDRKTQLSAAKRALLAKRLRGEKGNRQPADVIPKQQLSGPLPLAYAQQRIWFMHQLAPGSAAYNMHEAWRVRGPLDLAALEGALNQVVVRQPSLRTTITVVDDQPLQCVAETVTLPVSLTDLSRLAAADRENALYNEAAAEAQRSFDLAAGPLLRLTVLRLDREDHALLLTMHHIISDEWSSDLFWRELSVFYEHSMAGTAVTLSPLPIHYTDFARWQQTQLDAGAWQPQLDYWQRQLGGKLPLLQLPTDRPRPAQQTFRGAFIQQVLPASLLADLKALSRSAGTTLYMTLLAAFQLLLHRISHQDDILVGTPIANRQRPETKDVMGMFINTLVMRADFSAEFSFRALLEQTRQTALDAYANQDLPFEQLVQALQTQRNTSHHPLFQAMFVYQSTGAVRKLPGLDFRPISVDGGVAKFDLSLFASEEDGRLTTALEYNSDLFEAATIERMLGYWQTLLKAVAADPVTPVGELPLLTAAERAQILGDWNETAVPFPDDQCLHDLIAAHAQKSPGAPAVRFGEQLVNYAELDDRAAQVAAQLQANGVSAGDLVALAVPRSLEMIIGIVGILKVGAAYIPIDPTYPAERRQQILDDAQTAATLTIDDIRSMSEERGPIASRQSKTVNPESLAYVIYTSGSTGRPKGVMITHRNIVHSTTARFHFYSEPVERFLLLSSFAFDSSMVGIFWTLCQGGTLILPPPSGEQDAAQIARLIADHQITHLLALPSLYQILLEETSPAHLQSLTTIMVAGEACPPELAAQHFGRLPHTALYNEYGPTEATVWSHAYRIPADFAGTAVPIGKPIPNVTSYVLDGNRQPVPVGVPGELYIGGAGVTPGYLNRPELTTERFVNLKFKIDDLRLESAHHNLQSLIENRKFYRTGDLVKWLPDGNLLFLGRVDHQVKIRGFRVELGEIEAVMAAHPAVQEAVVVAHGGHNPQLWGYVTGKTAVTPNTLLIFLQERLPRYMIPASISVLTALPRTPNGKVDRQALPKPQGVDTPSSQTTFTPPSTKTEQKLAALWQEVLSLELAGVHDNFFDSGGHSLVAMRLLARMQRTFCIELPVQVIFDTPTIAGLAAKIEQAQQTSSVAPTTPSIKRVARDTYRRPARPTHS
jgi:amino acid adenylation domain-containing protein